MTEDIAAKIREALDRDYAGEDCPAAQAVSNVVDLCERYAGWSTFSVMVLNNIADSFGISVSPLRGPSDQSGVGVRPCSGDPDPEGRAGVNYVLGWKVEPSPCGMSCPCNEDSGVEAGDDREWLDADVLFERAQDAQTGYEG